MGIIGHDPPVGSQLFFLLNSSFITLYLLAFYVIFECVLNVFAEITLFADRGFYDAWWNSTTWDQVRAPPSVQIDDSLPVNGINQFTYSSSAMFIILQYPLSASRKRMPLLSRSFYLPAFTSFSWHVCSTGYGVISYLCRSFLGRLKVNGCRCFSYH